MSNFACRVFLAVVEQRSFVKAAQSMFLSPPAVSQAIAKLEHEYGLNLFVRDRNGAHLTSDGEKLLPSIRAVIDAEEHLSQQISQIKGLETGSVCIGTFNSVCVNWIPGIVKSFKKIYPRIQINICEGGYTDIEEWLHTGYADMGFLSLTVIRPEKFTFYPLFRDRMMCITSRDFRPGNPNFVTIDDIRPEQVVYQRAGFDAEANAVLSTNNLPVNSSFEIESDDATVALVESGFGVCFLPELALKRSMHNASVYPVEPPLYRTIVLAIDKDRPLSAAAEKMRDHILDYLKNELGDCILAEAYTDSKPS